MNSASKKIVRKFHPKFEGPYEVMKVENNIVVIWKDGDVETDRSNDEESRAAQEAEGSQVLAREKST
ncbi:hypothetical protein TNCV_84931 [Trichonephila clavipes]|nr:hypothetical protein TNCV_84931 [Trichonephila clavipes]